MNKITFIVLKKELKDLFRDKKTLLIGILIPLLIMPILFGVMGNSISKNIDKAHENINIILRDEGNSALGQSLKSSPNITIIESDTPEEEVQEGKVALYIQIPQGFDEAIEKESEAKLKIYYDNTTQGSLTAYSIINSFIDEYSKVIVENRLSSKGVDTKILTPIETEEITAVKDEEGQGIMMLSMILPLFLVLYSAVGPTASATDLGAGEKERGTLEPLLSTQAGRLSILWGKFLAITLMGIISTLASMAGVMISITKNPTLFGSTSGFSIEPKAIAAIALVSILITMVFGALELAVSIYARSFKEAQTYLSPLSVIAIIPAYGAYMMDAKNIATATFHVPIMNAVALIKEMLVGVYNPMHIAITFGWIAVYIIASVLFARYMFTREEVIFRT